MKPDGPEQAAEHEEEQELNFEEVRSPKSSTVWNRENFYSQQSIVKINSADSNNTNI